MKRRDFLLLTTAGIATLVVPTAWYLRGSGKYERLLAQPQSLSLIWDTGMTHEMGIKYQDQFPDETNVRTLVRHLSAETSGVDDALALSIARNIKKDFVTGNTIMLDGWILSKTEARQCALFSTTHLN